MSYKKGDIVSRTDTLVTGTINGNHLQTKICSDGISRLCISVQWNRGLGSNFGPQWTPLHLIKLEAWSE